AIRAHADRDLVLHAGRVEEVPVQLAVGERCGLDELRQAHSGPAARGVRRQERMVSRRLDDRVEGAGGLRLGRDRLVANGARGQLDYIPGQDVRGNELGERRERAPAELALSPGFDDRPSEPVCGAHVRVSEPGHGVTGTYSSRCAGLTRRGTRPADWG